MADLVSARGYLTALGAAALSLLCSTATLAQNSGAPPPTFGTSPSGEVPIIFSPLDEHVYARPDEVKAGRLLTAVAKDGTLLDPLRSLFEQLGATVTYDASTQTLDVAKPSADVKVSLNKKSITLNGERRPLDAGPEMYHGFLLVPLRVISEALGAYVVWVADKRLVVVRYVPPPVPTAAPATPAAEPAASTPPTLQVPASAPAAPVPTAVPATPSATPPAPSAPVTAPSAPVTAPAAPASGEPAPSPLPS